MSGTAVACSYAMSGTDVACMVSSRSPSPASPGIAGACPVSSYAMLSTNEAHASCIAPTSCPVLTCVWCYQGPRRRSSLKPAPQESNLSPKVVPTPTTACFSRFAEHA
eukprot:847771-Rhodomonas_salina.1